MLSLTEFNVSPGEYRHVAVLSAILEESVGYQTFYQALQKTTGVCLDFYDKYDLRVPYTLFRGPQNLWMVSLMLTFEVAESTKHVNISKFFDMLEEMNVFVDMENENTGYGEING